MTAGQSISGRISLSSFRKGFSMSAGRRPFGNIPKRRSILIVCEGVQTEVNYFNAIAHCLPRNMVENVVVEGAGGSPDYLLKYARQKIEERQRVQEPPFYHVWLVFDRDQFEHFTDTIRNVDRLNAENAAKKKAERPVEHWHCAWSNEAFELWYVLHFREQLGGRVSRTMYRSMIEEDIRRLTGERDYRYQKNDPQMFQRLHSYTLQAVERAERGLKRQIALHGEDWASMNPATTVHWLVRDLLAYMQKGQE